jgi:hypothetical protein
MDLLVLFRVAPSISAAYCTDRYITKSLTVATFLLQQLLQINLMTTILLRLDLYSGKDNSLVR